jgi:polyphosphate kinase
MPRNLYERVEVLFPLKDPQLKDRVTKEILPAYLADNRKARVLGSNGLYTHSKREKGARPFSVQDYLMSVAHGEVNGSGKPKERQTTQVVSANGKPSAAALPPAAPIAPEEQDSSNATV